MSRGMVLMLTGVSAAGKSTIQKILKDRMGWMPIISYTTRPPRPGEVDGVDYRFVTEREFELLHPTMCEAAEVHGFKYGRPGDDIEDCLNNGTIGVMAIDYKGAGAMKERYGRGVRAIFLHIQKHEQHIRLIERGTDSPEVIAKRMAAYDEEAHGCAELANLMVMNTDLEWSVKRIISYTEGQ